MGHLIELTFENNPNEL